ncbi:MAG TPA: NADH-quinone oxidoreductase subunit NuoG [Thiobacillaceae bacterium]|nr:NADH-quinone oxidoreductase subunit NuoG [Thiobacillaceae bacterium]HNU63957.1 NADH-quinone oxidoreductase subunit NuoG [Thiobacillaceae bacterium]
MPLIEIDGLQVEVAPGATVMDAAHQAGIAIPHFCYHKKLSIAANCRMCLVEVEKAPKPLPACATPATDGMKVKTHSPLAVEAQKGVMEFLLINHPLDCPVCDQGGECTLQDLAVGYGASASRYGEAKRVVTEKDLGPLIATDMTRCIHCSRCVRFLQEVGGLMELGMAHRGEHAEIMPFLEVHVGHELSGNVIDLCPVGALTSKPFRYTARPWELSRRKAVSPHDGLGANLQLHVKNGRVMRVLPQENEPINECWIPDRDRYSYQALHSAERLTRPLVKEGGQWVEAGWQDALERVARKLVEIRKARGGAAIGGLASAHQTTEELYLFAKVLRGLSSESIDHRLAQAEDARGEGVRWLGLSIADMEQMDRFLLVGASLRTEQPLLAHRVRRAVHAGAQLSLIHAADDDLLCRVHAKLITPPGAWVHALAQIAKALHVAEVEDVRVSDAARTVAESLLGGERKAVLLGAVAQNHPDAGRLQVLAQAIAQASGASLGFLAVAANSVGAQLVGVLPGAQGLNARAMLQQPRHAYVLMGVEPELDAYDASAARAALEAAEFSVALTAFRAPALEACDVLLPIAPFSETAGCYVNMEGRLQCFHAAVKPQGEARPAWKVLRVLGNLLSLNGFDYDSVEAVRADALPQGQEGIAAHLNNAPVPAGLGPAAARADLVRLGETGLYDLDPLTRRAPALQAQAGAAVVSVGRALFEQLGVAEGTPVRVRQAGGRPVRLPIHCDARLAEGVVRVPAGGMAGADLGGRLDAIFIEREEP